VPELVIMQPRDEAELGNMMYTATQLGRPVVIRYPRGTGRGAALPDRFVPIETGEAAVVRDGRGIQIWALGDMVDTALAAADLLAAEGITPGVVNARFVRPLDTDLLDKQVTAGDLIVTVENGVLRGGFGSSVQEFLAEAGHAVRVLRFGWPDKFVPHGSADILMEQCGLTAGKIAQSVMQSVSADGEEAT
jgi:1-deoxy-D-xylulose-5-phosphate synthase